MATDTPHSYRFRVLLRKEGRQWVAQCLEKDIAAQGRTVRDAMTSFLNTLLGQLAVDLAHKQVPFEGLAAAPDYYEEMWSEGARLERPPVVIPDDLRAKLPPAFMADALISEMRVGG
jgi:hypothetical protein